MWAEHTLTTESYGNRQTLQNKILEEILPSKAPPYAESYQRLLWWVWATEYEANLFMYKIPLISEFQVVYTNTPNNQGVYENNGAF